MTKNMAPKKREKDSAAKRLEQVHADHEQFLQAFEKPTQIYKYLKSRSKFSPLFLNRNLTYMPKRHRPKKDPPKKGPPKKDCPKSGKSSFDFDSLLKKVENIKNEVTQIPSNAGFLTITYLGFYNKEAEYSKDPVKVETLLLKICHKKRKDTSCPVNTVTFDTVFAPSNPSNDSCMPTKTTVSIPTESFSLSNGHIVKSYHLLLRVGTHGSNGYLHKESPAQKKRKLSLKDDGGVVMSNCNGVAPTNGFGSHQYGTNLIVYDKQNRCLLPDGEYQLLLHELSSNCPNTKLSHLSSSWETLPVKENDEGRTSGFEKYTLGPTLRFRLRWTTEPSIEIPKKICNGEYNGICRETRLDISKIQNGSEDINHLEYKPKIVYQFLYNDNSRQQTEASEDLHCPWCSIDCYALYSLLKHLKLCHSRFSFSYVKTSMGARIDVAINEQYDGSYMGGPTRDSSNGTVGYAFSRAGPVRRTCVSNILVCHPKKKPRRASLSEFLNEVEENETFDSQRSYVTGHNRLYHHTSTCLPIHPKEMEVDSEDEGDPKWLQKKTQMMIDEFTDVNDGEKELMKMWNLHVMRYGFVGDCQIPLACHMFLENRGKELLSKNLYRNFVLHVCNLYDFGLISPVTVYTTIQRLQELIGENTDVSKILHESCQAQRKHWLLDESSRKQKQIKYNNDE